MPLCTQAHVCVESSQGGGLCNQESHWQGRVGLVVSGAPELPLRPWAPGALRSQLTSAVGVLGQSLGLAGRT